MSSWIIGKLAGFKSKSIPTNPNSTSSEDYDEEDPPSQRRASVSSSDEEPQSSDEERLLPISPRSAAVKEQRIAFVARFTKKLAEQLAATALSHFAPGTGGVLNINSVFSTASHGANLRELLEDECSAGEPEICKGLLAYVITQKDKKLGDAVVKCLPGVGTIANLGQKFHWLDKKVAGTAGEDRMAQARLLVDHAQNGKCHIALAIYAEVVCKDSTKKEAWQAALQQIEESEVWGLSDEDPINPAAAKLARKIKPVQ